MDELKKYLQEKKEELDAAMPGASVRDRIHTSLHQPVTKTPVVPLYRKWIAAASVILIVAGTIYVAGIRTNAIVPVAMTDTARTRIIRQLVDISSFAKLHFTLPELPAGIQSRPDFKTMDTILTIGYRKAGSPSSAKIGRMPGKKIIRQENPALSFEAGYASLVDQQLDQLRKLPVYVSDPGYFGLFKQQFRNLANQETELKKIIRKDGISEESLEGLVMIYQQKINILRNLQFEINRANAKIREHTPDKDLKPTYINL